MLRDEVLKSRTLKDEVWHLTSFLELVNDEIRPRRNYTVPQVITSKPQDHFKGNRYFEGKDRFYYNRILVHVCMYHTILIKFCVFCDKNRWSDKCQTITGCNARKDFLKSLNRCFLCLKENHKL